MRHGQAIIAPPPTQPLRARRLYNRHVFHSPYFLSRRCQASNMPRYFWPRVMAAPCAVTWPPPDRLFAFADFGKFFPKIQQPRFIDVICL